MIFLILSSILSDLDLIVCIRFKNSSIYGQIKSTRMGDVPFNGCKQKDYVIIVLHLIGTLGVTLTLLLTSRQNL